MKVKARDIDISSILEPQRDSRFWRDPAWEAFLQKDIGREGGIIIPILVKRMSNGRFLVVEGVTRLRASKAIGLKTIKCNILPESASESDILIWSIKTNYYRKKSDFIAISEQMLRLKKEHGYRNRDLVKRFGLSKSWVTKLLSLNRLSDSDKLKVAMGELKVEQAYYSTLPKSLARETIYKPCDACGVKAHVQDVKQFRLCRQCQEAFSRFRQLIDAKRRLLITRQQQQQQQRQHETKEEF